MAILGYNATPGDEHSMPTGIVVGHGPFQASENGTATSVSIYLYASAGASITLGIATLSGDTMTLLGQTAGAAPTAESYHWHSQNLVSPVSLVSGTNYYIVWNCSGDLWFYTDDDGAIYAYDKTNSYSAGNLPATWAAAWLDEYYDGRKPGAYITYSTSSLTQSHARFRNDDGSETTATWAAAEDANDTVALATARRLRVSIKPTGDPSATAYTLRAQKNGSGGYTAVPVGTTGPGTKPLIEAGDCTVSGSNTEQSSWAVSHPNASAGDLLIWCIAWDDSTTTTDVTEPAGPNSEVLSEINATAIASASTEIRVKCWYTIATGSWSAGTTAWTPSATESWSATCIRVPSGEFDASTPIGAVDTRASGGTSETSVLIPDFTLGATDGGGTLVWMAGVDADPLSATPPSGFTELQRQDLGACAHGVCARTAATTNSEVIAGTDAWTIAGDSWASVAFVVRAPVVNNQVYIATSDNITAGGEATTALLTSPGGTFQTGRMWDNENGTDTLDLDADKYTEVEWCLKLQSPAASSDYWDFRVYAGTSALGTYTVTPRLTVAAAAVTLTPPVCALTLAGKVPTRIVSHIAAPAVVALVLAGVAPNPYIGVAVDVPACALTLAGQTPTRIEHSIRLPAVASLTLAGTTSTVLAGTRASPELGELTLAGVAPRLGLAVSVPHGTLTLAGQDEYARENLLIRPDVGGLSLVGVVPALREAVIRLPAAAALVLAGSPSNVLTDFRRTPPVGALALAGLVPTLEQGPWFVIPAGTLVLTGSDNQAEHYVGNQTVALTLQGYAPSISSERRFIVPVGTLTLTPMEFRKIEPFVVEPTVGSLTLAGIAPQPSSTLSLEVPVCTLVLSGQVPLTGGDHTVFPSEAVLTLTGVVATIIEAEPPKLILSPDTAHLVIEGIPPHHLGLSIGNLPAGALVLAGVVPTVIHAHTRTPATGSLTLAGVPIVPLPRPIWATTRTAAEWNWAGPWVDPNLISGTDAEDTVWRRDENGLWTPVYTPGANVEVRILWASHDSCLIRCLDPSSSPTAYLTVFTSNKGVEWLVVHTQTDASGTVVTSNAVLVGTTLYWMTSDDNGMRLYGLRETIVAEYALPSTWVWTGPWIGYLG